MERVFRLAEKLGAHVVQTHTSWVLILYDVVYKIKKPVNFGFLDYSTLEKRKEMCYKEVDLNRRLCKWIYLGVVPISEENGEWIIEKDTNVVEYAVKMRRIPEDRVLSNRLDSSTKEDLIKVAQVIASFHQKAKRVDEFGKIEIMKFNTDENFSQTEKYIGLTIDKEDYEFIKNKTNRFYKVYKGLFEKRIIEGKIRDGHGDIRTEHVAFLEKGICIFDCIEFNDRFRYGDVLNDMCFLSMELEYFGREDLAKAYEETYREFTKDEDFEIMLPFFKCYRAYVRGKVNSFLLDDPGLKEEEKREAKARAEKFFKLARKYAESIPL
ncbi:MAG TPA: gluconokinase [Aquifex aeolicus]|nr:gluconokinase [Aquifex aeolicus]